MIRVLRSALALGVQVAQDCKARAECLQSSKQRLALVESHLHAHSTLEHPKHAALSTLLSGFECALNSEEAALTNQVEVANGMCSMTQVQIFSLMCQTCSMLLDALHCGSTPLVHRALGSNSLEVLQSG
jgi:hypothetical protein